MARLASGSTSTLLLLLRSCEAAMSRFGNDTNTDVWSPMKFKSQLRPLSVALRENNGLGHAIYLDLP